MILLILVVLWIVVLAPAAVKKLLDRRSSVSIDSFHQQLHLLERAGPKLVPPAYRLETAQSATGMAVGQSGYPAVSSRPGRPNLVLLQPVPEDEDGAGCDVVDAAGDRFRRVAPAASAGARSAPSWPERMDDLHHRQVRRRRRDLLLGMAATVAVSGLIGIAVPLFWVLTVLATVALAGYVGLAAYAQVLEEADRRLAGRRPGRPGDGWSAGGGYPADWREDDGDLQPLRQVAAGGR